MASIRARLMWRLIELSARLPWTAKPPFPSVEEVAQGLTEEHKEIIEARRARMERMARRAAPPREARFRRVDADGVPVTWVSGPGAKQDRAILYLHGGGYYAGSLTTHQALTSKISMEAGAPLLLVDYRLAPEHPFPAAVEDATCAYRWLLRRGLSPERIAVAGDSAGGGLTVAAMLELKASGEPLPAAGVCLSPWFDLAMTGESIRTKASVDRTLRPSDMPFVAWCYLQSADPKAPTASPLYGDLTGLPPILIQVGTDEILLDDSRRFAEKANQMGVSVRLDIWDEMIHVWHAYSRFIPEARNAIAAIGEFLRLHWKS
jgi:monoterpene epsilon-lactone hydrolase